MFSLCFLFLTVILNISIFIIICVGYGLTGNMLATQADDVIFCTRQGQSYIFSNIYMDVNWKKNKTKQQHIQQYCHGNSEAKREPNTLINELFLIISTWPDDYHRSGRHFRLPYIVLHLSARFFFFLRDMFLLLFVQSKKNIYIWSTNAKTMVTVMTFVYLFVCLQSQESNEYRK